MAVKQPVVYYNGLLGNLQAGDTIGGGVPQVNQTADAAVTVGMAVYNSAADHVNLAQANAIGTSRVLGLAMATAASGASIAVQTSGILALTTAQWDAVAGTTGGLAYNTPYYLDPANPGKITATAPSTAGQYTVFVGTALSTTELVIRVGQPFQN